MISYRELRNWKYQLMSRYKVLTPIRTFEHTGKFFSLHESGKLVVEVGYCWDGPSGPTWDSPNSLRPSLVHDVFYQLLRMEVLPQVERDNVDSFLHFQLKEAGMGRFRAWYFWKAVRLFGWKAAAVSKESSPVKQAP